MTKRNNLFIFILSLGAFALVNTQLAVVGILPLIAEHFHVSISNAGLMVSIFALVIAISAPIMPLLFSGINRKKVMLLSLGAFIASNVVSAFAPNFNIALIAYVIPAIFNPIYCSMAFTLAAASVSKEEAPKAVSKVFIGVSASMVVGVPVTSFIASITSLEMAMLSFAIINAIAFIATLLFVPSMPVTERLSYGRQLSVLKKPITWFSIASVILMNGAAFGAYSFITEYLEKITRVSANTISLMLLVFGAANIIGNISAGKLVTKNAAKTVMSFPFALGIVYIILFLLGKFTVPMALIILAWGILCGSGNIIFQYLISSAAPEAPDFANGLFFSATNLGMTSATTVCGFIISGIGIQYVMLGGVLFLILSIVTILLRNYTYNLTK